MSEKVKIIEEINKKLKALKKLNRPEGMVSENTHLMGPSPDHTSIQTPESARIKELERELNEAWGLLWEVGSESKHWTRRRNDWLERNPYERETTQ